MKIVILGGSGLIGSKLAVKLRAARHDVVQASLGTGVNILTGEGVAEVLEGAEVVVDVTNSPSFAPADVLSFFETAARVVLPLEGAAGVRHHVALSVVGAERLPDSGYLVAKVAQEAAIRASEVPFTIVRATQFFEFVGAIAEGSANGDVVTLPNNAMQVIAADDVAAALARMVEQPASNAMMEIAGPERVRMPELV